MGWGSVERDDVLARFREYHATGNRKIRDELIHDHMWIAEQCARRFANRGEPMDDLVQVALIGIVKAVERFDPELGHTFPAFATPTVTGELRRHFRDYTWDVRVPRRVKDLVGDLNATIGSLNQRLGRSPTMEEVARAMSVDVDVVLETMEGARGYRAASLDDTGHDDGHSTNAQDKLASDDSSIDDADLRLSASKMVGSLDERSQAIIVWRFYEGCTQTEIGERLGIGQVQVSRLLRAALAELRSEIGAGGGVADDWVAVEQAREGRTTPPPSRGTVENSPVRERRRHERRQTSHQPTPHRRARARNDHRVQ